MSELTGFEKFFITSCDGWDLMDTTAFYFYDVEPTEQFKIAGVQGGKGTGLLIDYAKCIVEFYGTDGEVCSTFDMIKVAVFKKEK